MHTLGLDGMPHRIATYANPARAITNMIIIVSSSLIAEWATSSPPPPYKFARILAVRSFMPLQNLRESGELVPESTPAQHRSQATAKVKLVNIFSLSAGQTNAM